MQSGKRLTLKDYFAKHTRTHKNHKNTNVVLSTQLSSSVIFRQYGVSQSECKIDRPRPGLPRVSPRPHTEALGTRLGPKYCVWTRFFSIFSDLHNTSYNLRVNRYCSRHIFLPKHLIKILTQACQK